MKEPILIVGAGPTGLSLALTLCQHQVPVRIIDRRPVPQKESRALALHSRTIEVFKDLGVVDSILDQGIKVSHLYLHLKKNQRAQFDLNVIKAPYPYIVVLPQNDTEHILTHKLHEYNVRVERGIELKSVIQDKDFVEINVQDEEGKKEKFKAPWVIGCEGVHSVIRESIGAEFNGYQYKLDFALADVQMESTLEEGSINSFVDEMGALLIIPIHNNFYRLIVQKRDQGKKRHTTLHEIEEIVKARALGQNKILDVEWITDFKINHRIANRYRKHRLMIAGDAAHVHSPVGGQGLNAGIQDAYNLGWKLAYVYRHNAETKLLSSYSRERIPVAKKILSRTNKLTKFISSSETLSLKYYSKWINILNRMPILKVMFLYEFSGISLCYKKSPIIQRQRRFFFFIPAITAGCRLFDGELIHSQSKLTKKVFDIIQGPDHHLFIFFKYKKYEKEKKIKELLEKRYSKLLKVHLITTNLEVSHPDCWLDPHKLNVAPYKQRLPLMVLIRPDGYIGMIKRKVREKSVIDYFQNLIGINQ